MREILKLIFTNPADSLSLFSRDDIDSLNFYEKNDGDGKYYIKSFSRGEEEKLVFNAKTQKAAPEEIVRQLFIRELIKKYNYPKSFVDIEKSIQFGREISAKRADIIVYQNDNATPSLIIEVKAPNEKNDVHQLKSYLNAEGAPIGVAINGKSQLILFRPYPKEFDDTLSDIPKYGETIDDVLNRRKQLKDLELPKQLKDVIKDMEELVLGNSGFDSFDEIFKLIYAKLYDESEALLAPESYNLEFRKHPSKDANRTKQSIDKLFEEAKRKWKGIFEKSDVIKLKPEHLSVCVGEIEKFKLLGANLQVIDEAFEYLIPEVAKSKKGQYFTPRILIDMCIQMLNPKKNEYVIDTACGSGGFLIHAMDYVYSQNKLNKAQMSNYAKTYLFGVDFDEKSSKIARAMMLIAGDGKSHIYKANSLDGTDKEWDEIAQELKQLGLLKEFDDYEEQNRNEKERLHFSFDILLANPPFAGEVKESRTLAKYDLGKKNGKNLSKVSRHILFIERNLNFVKPGGRLAVVLPQGIFNNTSEKYIREYISKHARILAVVGIEGNAFKPHTGTKTSVLFLQKWHNILCPQVDDYSIFFATSENSGKDTSGDYLHKKDEAGNKIIDEHGHTIIDHDLFEIADAFIKFAKVEGLSFWR